MKMHMRKHPTTFSLVMATLILAGCGGAVKYPNYYTLHVPPPPDPPAAENLHATLAIREFRSPVYLRQGPIVYKTSPEQIGFYNYHRWAVDPREFLTNAVTDQLRASGNFAKSSLRWAFRRRLRSQRTPRRAQRNRLRRWGQGPGCHLRPDGKPCHRCNGVDQLRF